VWVNELVLRLANSPAHHLMPIGLIRIAYTGSISGRAVCLPVRSVADESRFLVVAGRPERKRWWRTFRCPQPARLTRAGCRYDVMGQVSNTPVIAFTRSSPGDIDTNLSH
jgi:hypothetical protein